MKSVSLCIAGWQRQNEPSSEFSPRIPQKLHLISQKLHLKWLGCSGGCIYLRVPSLGFRKNFGLNGYGPPASPPLPLINTALPQSNNPLFQLRVPLVKLQKMMALGPISPLLSCPRGLLGLSCCSTPSCPCATTPRAEKKSRELPQAAPSAAAPRTRVREEQQPHQRGAPGLRRPQPPSCPRGLSCCSTPRSARAQRCHRAREKSPGSCRRPRPVPLHQEPGSERSSSRTRGANLACDGPTCSAKGGSCAAPRPAVRAQRRRLARNKAQEGALVF